MHRTQRWNDYPGLSVVRAVIGSYFMAIALGLISGVSPSALFLLVTDPQTADLLGTVLLFSVTAAFILGIFLRLTSLTLAIFVLASSVIQNLVIAETVLIEPIWRDLTMICAVLLSHTCLNRSEFNREALALLRSTARRSRKKEPVTPRRVTSGATAEQCKPQARLKRSGELLLQARPTATMPVWDGKRDAKAASQRRETEPESEVDNIFAAL